MRRVTSLAAALTVAAALLAAGEPAAGARDAATHAAKPTLTARVLVPSTARAAPRTTGRPRMILRGVTPYSGIAERLMVTGRHQDPEGRRWVRVQLPIRPNGSGGWVRAERVRLSGTRIRIVVRLGSRRLELWRGAHRLAAWRAGIGRPGTPTPSGRFAVQDPVPTLPGWRSVYGSFTITLTAHSPTLTSFMGGDARVAIHGPGRGRAWRVGAASSYGCVILAERALRVVARHARPGVPVVIDRS
jgi:lipoprotein-anchoring transpeptidase ErfK/SrfK